MTSRLQQCLQGRKAGRPLLVAHRGASAEAPENTLASIRKAWEYGVDGVEVDIHLSSDKKCIVIHDPLTDRTADHPAVVAACTADDLRGFDAGSWFDPRFGGERIPLIEEVLDTIPAGKFLCIELKDGRGLEEALRDRLCVLGREESVCVLAFDVERVARFKALMPDVPAFLLLVPGIDPATKLPLPFKQDVIERVKACGADAPACYEGAVTKEFVEAVHGAGMPLLVWVVDDPDRAQKLARWGVDAIATNDPAKILSVLAG